MAAYAPVYSPVRTMMLAVTDRCNLRCTYCRFPHTPRTMTVETARRAVDFFLDREVSGALYDIAISFFGGECMLLVPLLAEVVGYASRPRANTYKQVSFSATTNGTVAGPAVERLVRDSGMALLVSVDGGPAASRHRPFAGAGRSSYEVVVRNLPRLMSWTPHGMVRATFHPQALDLLGTVRHLLELGAPAIALCPVEEAPWAAHQEALEAAYEALADWFLAQARQGRPPPLVVTYQLLRGWQAARHGAGRPLHACGVGRDLLGVDPEGNVMPCHSFLSRPSDWLGTVASPQLSERRWEYVHLQSSDFEECAGCAAAPVCGGGCRAAALVAGRTLHQVHPGHCIPMRAHARAAARIYDTLAAEAPAALASLLAAGPRPPGALAELLLR